MIGVTLGTMLLTTTARMTRVPGLLWRHQKPQEPQEKGEVMGTVARPAGHTDTAVATHPQMDVVFLADHLGRVPSALLLDHLGAGFVVWEEGHVVSCQWSRLMKKHRSKIVLLCICVVRNEHSSLRTEDSSPRQGWVVGRQTPG